MRLQSLKSKLLLAVSALVITSGLLISLLVAQLYTSSLLETMTAQAESVAQDIALEATDKILINDLVALQKMLDYQMRSNPTISYLIVSRDEQVLAHTFSKGVPAGLSKANIVAPEGSMHFQKIAAASGKYYLDIAWPIFDGRAGVLRLGFSDTRYRQQMTGLWLQMSVVTLGILLLALSGTLLFVRRITRPLTALAHATQEIDRGEQWVRVQPQGQDEVGRLAVSFNHMVERMEEYTHLLEEQTMDLERAHNQTRSVCGILQDIGSLRNLKEIGAFLIKTFQKIIKCRQMVLLIFNGDRDLLFVISATDVKVLEEPEDIQTAWTGMERVKEVTFTPKLIFKPPLLSSDFQYTSRKALVPFHHENQLQGALAIACSGDCRCSVKEMDVVGLILAQAAGIIKRAVLQEEEMRDLESRIESSGEFSGIVGKDPKMKVIYKLIEDIAPTDATVLIQGESGTGKELVARAIHRMSPRKHKPFVVINCSAYAATLLESELFGHEKGAFTGAIRQKPGRFEQAHGGAVFLDEIGEIPPPAQIKLLRVLQTHKFNRLGGEEELDVDVRILAATNKDLVQEVKKGRFREDLFYRLNVIPIHLPPLRERRNDIPLLVRHFLRHFTGEKAKENGKLSPEAMRLLLDYDWPGNVRELGNSIEHATVLAKGGQIEASDLPAMHSAPISPAQAGGLLHIMAEHEKKLLKEILEECGWNKKQAAHRLGISRSAFYLKLKKYQITTRPTTH